MSSTLKLMVSFHADIDVSSPPLPDPPSHNYIVSAIRPTVVTAAVVGNFRTTVDTDLILARVDRLHYYLRDGDQLKSYREIPAFGRIATLNVFRLRGEDCDSIAVLNTKYQLVILSFDENGMPRKRFSEVVADRVGRPAETGLITCIHSSGMIALRLYDGFLKLIRWGGGGGPEDWSMFNIRFEHYNVTDFDFMDEEKPTIVYYHEDQHGKYMNICRIDLDREQFAQPISDGDGVEQATSLLIPVQQPCGGVIIVGQQSIIYKKGDYTVPIVPPQTYKPNYTCYARVGNEGNRFLLGDSSGRLLSLILQTDTTKHGVNVCDVKVEDLGCNISIPECLVDLGDSMVFVGSRFGDSQLVRLHSQSFGVDDNGRPKFVEVLDSINNIGPIRDFVIIDKHNQRQLVTCSGCYKDGTVRVVRNGIGINLCNARNGFSQVKDFFPISANCEAHNYVIVSYLKRTRVISANELLPNAIINEIEVNERTLFAGNLGPNRIVQVVPTAIRLFSCDGTFRTKFEPLNSVRFTVCAVNVETGQLVVAAKAEIYYYEIASDEIRLVSQYTCAGEVSCLDISSIEPGEKSRTFVAGLWHMNTLIFFRIEPKLEIFQEEVIGSEVLRSVLMLKMESVLYLFVTSGNGTVYYIRLEMSTGKFLEQKKVIVGVLPATLKKFTWKGSSNVFVCSNRPAVISSVNNKLFFYNVNMGTVEAIASLNSTTYPEHLLMWDGKAVISVGTIDCIQKLHISTHALNETVSRIAYQSKTKTAAILTTRYEDILRDGRRRCPMSVSLRPSIRVNASNIAHSTNNEPSCAFATTSSCDTSAPPGNADDVVGCVEVHSICILDVNNKFKCLAACQLADGEYGLSLCSVKLGADLTPYYVVGTAHINNEDKEPKTGRIIVLQICLGGTESQRLRIIYEKETRGAVYAVSTLAGKLICTINSTVRLFEWTADRELRLECSHFNHVAALYLKTKGDMALVGDLMRSMCVVSYKADDSSFVEIARDYSVQWMSACEIIDSETYLGAENHYNIFTCKKNNEAASEEERSVLQPEGKFYLGQMVNVFRRGTIIPNEPEASMQHLAESNAIMYGTSDGGIGVIVQITPKLYEFLTNLEKRVADATTSPMDIRHSNYRRYCVDRILENSSGFIDGDLIETIAEMPPAVLQSVLTNLMMPSLEIADLHSAVEEKMKLATAAAVLKFVEDISRIH